MNNLDKLEKLTHILPSLSGLVKVQSEGCIEYDMAAKNHKVTGKNIFNDGLIAIQEVTSIGKGEFPSRCHTVHEWLIVLNGCFSYKEGNKNLEILENGFAYFAPHTEHKLIFTKNCTFLAITVPAEEDCSDDAS